MKNWNLTFFYYLVEFYKDQWSDLGASETAISPQKKVRYRYISSNDCAANANIHSIAVIIQHW